MLRSFLPIGQGFFAIEHFKNFTAIFNCGGSSIKIINNQINNILSKYSEIDALFITDLQNNYTNGLEYLLNNYKVNNLIIPYLNKDERLLTLLNHLLYGKAKNDFLVNLLLNNRKFLKNNKVIEVVGKHEFIFKDFKECFNDSWIFSTHNFRKDKIIEKFKEGLKKYNLENLSFENIFHLSTKDATTIKKIIREEVGGQINPNSLVVYSGPVNMKMQDYSIDSFEKPLLKGGCLYLGDFDTNKYYKEFYESFCNFHEFVGTVTLPQHGNRNYYNKRLCLDCDSRFVVTSSNKYIDRFPNKEVLRSIMHYDKIIYIIDELNHPYEQIIGDKSL
ncbi:MAG TPA: hypothetical protein GXZ48_01805 [Acholeplasmataceae bacterium]|nr:hypothetical protein [Acholeplasmataceae bacterium]